MKYILITLLFLTNIFADDSNKVFQELLQKVKSGYKIQTIEDKNREQEFLKDVKNQQNIVSQTRSSIKKEKAISNKIKTTIKTNEIKLQKLSEELNLATGNLGELFGTVNQVSADMLVHIKESLISSQFPKRKEFLKNLTSKNELPDIQELEKLWYIMFQEILESGKIVKYKTKVILKDGKQGENQIIRFGNFNAITKNSFLKYDSSNSLFIEPSFQPQRAYTSVTNDYFDSEEKVSEAIIDPTRGTILNLISQKPSLKQRIMQGGVIGYIILGLGVIGLIFTFGKYLWFIATELKIKKQIKNISNIKIDNPLSRILETFEKNKHLNIADLEYKVDEAFYKEIPPLQSGLSMIKLFAATAPLLGLLGTVTGMILTFQSITLFGTSDPTLMAGGISQALITTMLGLMVAIPLLFVHTFLSAKSKKIINILEQNSITLVAKKMDDNV